VVVSGSTSQKEHSKYFHFSYMTSQLPALQTHVCYIGWFITYRLEKKLVSVINIVGICGLTKGLKTETV